MKNGMQQLSVRRIPLYDCRADIPECQRVRRGPELHLVHGLAPHLPWLTERAVVCLSDWQFDVPSQRHFWTQTVEHLRDELGAEQFAQAIFLVAGDMASSDNTLRGVASDAAPDFSWLLESLAKDNELYVVYGNHDVVSAEHVDMRNSSGTRCILPHEAIAVAGVAEEDAGPQIPALKEELSAEKSTKDPVGFAKLQAGPVAANLVGDEVPTNEAMQGLSKAERAAYYQQMRAHNSHIPERKTPKLTKLQRQEKQWRDQNAEEANLVEHLLSLMNGRKTVASTPQGGGNANSAPGRCRRVLRIGCVHGIPASHSQGFKKIERTAYLRALRSICCPPGEMSDEAKERMDILMTHSNPCLPGQEDVVRGDDAKEIFRLFMMSSARLHVHGHQHTPEVVSVIDEGKVVVNCDLRVVVLMRTSHTIQ